MAHELFGQRFYGYREPAWHGLGKVFTHEPTAVEAFQEAGLMYEIRKVPVFAYVDGINHLVKDQWALVREPTEDDPEFKVFGLVGEQYCVVNNADIAPIVDILAREWPIETVGALKEGRTIFVTLRAGLDEIEGDEIAKFFLLTDTKDGSGALKLAFTPVRVVCQNTLTSALHGTRDQFSLIHNDFVRMDLKAAIDIIAASKRQEANVLEVFRHMAAVQRDIEELDRIIEAAYPLPGVGRWERHLDTVRQLSLPDEVVDRVERQHERYEAKRAARLKLRQAAKTLYEQFCDSYPRLAGTPWAMYNAVVELEDWRDGNGGENEAVLFGNRAERKESAYKAAVALLS